MSQEQLKRDIRSDVDRLLALKQEIDEAWRAGDRTMLLANVFGAIDATLELNAALEAQDPASYRAAADKLGERAFSARVHANNWLKSKAN